MTYTWEVIPGLVGRDVGELAAAAAVGIDAEHLGGRRRAAQQLGSLGRDQRWPSQCALIWRGQYVN
jgi:hypothetical protein